mgnify:CR=1 FL=1
MGYFKVNYTLYLPHLFDCRKKEDPLLKNFYFNETTQEYRPCYKTCKTCLKGGDAEANNCLECGAGYMFRPGDNPKNNCVAYSEYYYLSNYDQYKGLNIFQCPEIAKYKIKDKKSCIDDCKKDEEYKYLYNGICFKECPTGTQPSDYICRTDSEKCSVGEDDDLHLYDNNKCYWSIGEIVYKWIYLYE